jgi:hypothetical protein
MSTLIKITAPGVHLQATTSPGDRVALPDRGAGAQILLYNDTAALGFVAFVDADVVAAGGTTAPDIPEPPGAMLTLARAPSTTHVAAITTVGAA